MDCLYPANKPYSSYLKGCRCPRCRQANREATRIYRARLKAAVCQYPDLAGNLRGYKLGCRCEDHRAVKAAERARYAAGQTSRGPNFTPIRRSQPVRVHGHYRGQDVDAIIARAAEAMFTTVDDHRQHRTREAS